MKFHIMTLFPEMIEAGLRTSIIGRAIENGIVDLCTYQIRDFSADRKHHKVDDYTYGGGAGMLMQAQPIYDCYVHVLSEISKNRTDSFDNTNTKIRDVNDEITNTEKRSNNNEIANTEIREDYKETANAEIRENNNEITDTKNREITNIKTSTIDRENINGITCAIYVTPQGKPFTQDMARDYAKVDDLIILCGHYEGVDERVLEETGAERVSIGDYVLTGGELPAMVIVDAIARLVPGVLSNEESAQTESFDDGLLEYPQYTRPEVWRERRVPEILLSGDHAKVDQWRHEQSVLRTKEMRPDLYEAYCQRE